MQHEVGVLDEKPAHAAKINCAKEVVKVNIEHVASFSMLYGISDD